MTITIKILKTRDRDPLGYMNLTENWVFDINLGLARKSQILAGDHLTEPTQETNHISVVSRYTVIIILKIEKIK